MAHRTPTTRFQKMHLANGSGSADASDIEAELDAGESRTRSSTIGTLGSTDSPMVQRHARQSFHGITSSSEPRYVAPPDHADQPTPQASLLLSLGGRLRSFMNRRDAGSAHSHGPIRKRSTSTEMLNREFSAIAPPSPPRFYPVEESTEVYDGSQPDIVPSYRSRGSSHGESFSPRDKTVPSSAGPKPSSATRFFRNRAASSHDSRARRALYRDE
ncbi:hypothetical protein AAVH_32596 [Aphelenchoides avenae]|nr:hypothetical protein AAVH_32596 [Aphelenchus avenae]